MAQREILGIDRDTTQTFPMKLEFEDLPEGLKQDIHSRYNFTSASTVWEAIHNIGKIPSLQCFTIDGEQMEGDVLENTTTKFRVEFNYDQAGYVILN